MGPRKECSACKMVLPHSDFYKQKNGRFGLSPACKKCHGKRTSAWNKKNIEYRRKTIKEWRDRNIEKIRAQATARRNRDIDKSREKERKKSVFSTYGITFEQKQEMFDAQGRKCASCDSADPGSKKGWHIDHCHETGMVRAILCHPCNAALGNAGDSIERLQQLVSYLKKHLKRSI